MVGLFAVDGGNATGLAWGIFNEEAKSTQEAVEGCQFFGSDTLNRKVTRDKKRVVLEPLTDMEQVVRIYTKFLQFKNECIRQHRLDADWVHLIIEDFILLPGPHAGGRDGVASIRIAWGLAGLQMGYALEYARRHKRMHVSEPVWQNPSAQGYAKDDMLRRWGIWEDMRGDHERSAFKHIAYWLNKRIR